MKALSTLLCLFLFVSLNYISATVYTTTSNGNINGSIWSPSTPSSPLAAGDEMIINHDVTLNVDFTVYGKMTISFGATLSGSNKKLKIGEGGTTGELINNGTLIVKDLNVKGDDSVENLTAPSATNNGSITASKMHIGDNSAAGVFINNVAGKVTVNGEVHLDNLITNLGEMTVTGKFKNHGGTVQGGGMITNCEMEFEENDKSKEAGAPDRPGTLLDQDICCDFSNSTEPTYTIKDGSSYTSLDLLVGSEGLSSADHSIDEVDFYSCGVNSLGQLPVELINFSAKENLQHLVDLSWTTESEINNQHFVIQRAPDGRNFETLGVVEGNGTTTFTTNYSFTDSRPIPMAYYRLQQIDYDGSFEFSEVLTLEMKDFQSTQIDAFPTHAENEITLRFNTFDTRKSILKIVDSFGRLMYEEEIYSTGQLEYRSLDLAKYQNGVYSISLSDGLNLTTHLLSIKLIKRRKTI